MVFCWKMKTILMILCFQNQTILIISKWCLCIQAELIQIFSVLTSVVSKIFRKLWSLKCGISWKLALKFYTNCIQTTFFLRYPINDNMLLVHSVGWIIKCGYKYWIGKIYYYIHTEWCMVDAGWIGVLCI